MTCLEAQSKIIAYIDYNLEKDQKTEFLKHIRCCENCKDELNIYYTMIEGMRQLDNNMPLSKDFSVELDNRIEHELRVNKNKKSVMRSSIVVMVIVLFSFVLLTYANFLNIIHEEEQAKLKAAQGEYYYYQTFDHYMFEPEEHALVINVEEETPEMSFYERVRYYKVLNH